MKREVIFQNLNWRLNDIVTNLKAIVGQGFTTIQVSPMQQHKEANNPAWWLGYQITNFKIGNRLGNEEDLKILCDAAHKLNIKIIVDVVCNHVANDGYGKDFIPSKEVEAEILNNPYFFLTPFEIDNWYDRYQVCYGNCGWPKLNTANKELQCIIIHYLCDLMQCGVDGFRFDAAKHIPVEKNFNNDFWPTITKAIRNIKNDAFIYGELQDLDTPLIDEYAQYINVGVNNRLGSDPTKKVIYNLSHDDILTFNVKSNKGWNTLLDEHEYLLKSNPDSHILYYPHDEMWRESRMSDINHKFR